MKIMVYYRYIIAQRKTGIVLFLGAPKKKSCSLAPGCWAQHPAGSPSERPHCWKSAWSQSPGSRLGKFVETERSPNQNLKIFLDFWLEESWKKSGKCGTSPEVGINLRQVTKALWHASQKYLAKFQETWQSPAPGRVLHRSHLTFTDDVLISMPKIGNSSLLCFVPKG